MARGRPKKYKNAAELQKRIDDYFAYCGGIVAKDADGQPIFCKNGTLCYIEQPKPQTVTGLAYYLGLTRQGLLEYQCKEEFSDTITRAKQRIEMYAEERLFDRDGQRGAEFSLRNNFQWGASESSAETIAKCISDHNLLLQIATTPMPNRSIEDFE